MVNWYIEPEAIALFHQGNSCRAQLVFSGQGAGQAIAAGVERLVDQPVAAGVRAACADLPGLARWGELRREQLGVEREIARVQTVARRIDAEKAEAVLLAAPGWSQTVVLQKEAELVRLEGEFAALTARAAAMTAPIDAARAVCERQARSARYGVANRVQVGLQARRAEVLAKAGPLLGSLLTELIELETALDRGRREAQGAALGISEAPGPFVDLTALADRAAELAQAGRAAAQPAA